ncbi:G1 family glutamic endopeptidase [Streptacidiphilus anmyonensis]|uniref:G1 family glutamic endopeptidase n=1 Tax=Streptacidiphilus anmyonensis TaxID=405782 RepID=UPI0005A88C2A|nr:G1 family glutamic endopeptidase [Streptacidiphilus anmyonensis]
MPRRSARLLVVAVGVGAAALSTPAFAAAPTAAHAAQATPAQLTQAVAGHESHALHGARRSTTNTAVESTNWSGYAATGSTGAFTSVSASWVQPSVSCGSATTYSSFWVGLDGYSNSALEQTGTEADCIGGRATYGAWWEVLPASESAYSGVTVAGGDSLTATVTDNGNGTFTMTLTDSTEGWSKSTTHAGSSGYQDSSAEVIAEAPEVNGGIAKLANFGTVDFTGSTAGGQALGNTSPNEITMINSAGTKVRAQPGTISGGSFADVWKSS